MKKTLTLMAFGLCTAFNCAHADTYDATLSGDGYIFGNSFSGTNSFEDYIAFTTEGIQEIVASISGTGNSGFSFTAFNLLDSDKNLIETGSVIDVGTKFSFGSVSSTQEGKYYLQVIGNSVGSTAGYNGTITVTSTPVPEPSSVAMLLSGLGILGVGFARSKKSYQV